MYLTNFAMMQHHNYSLTELENMIPFEREIYVSLLEKHIEEENKRTEEENRLFGIGGFGKISSQTKKAPVTAPFLL